MPADVRPITAGGSDRYYLHQQVLASATWVVAHNLGKKPSVTVIDSAGSHVIGDVEYPDDNHVIVTFAAPFSGTAACN